MASESTEEEVTVRLPSDLGDWLDERASELGVDRETLLVQTLASYRATAELDGDVDAAELGVDVPEDDDIEAVVDSRLDAVLEERIGAVLDERVEEHVEGQVRDAVDAAVTERLTEAADAVEQRVDSRVESLEDEFQGKIEDVRERVIQVKQETDAKAPADHDHEEFEQFVALGKRLDKLEADIDDLNDRFDAALPEQEEAIEELEERLDTVQDRLQTVAWVVRDLRDSYEAETELEAVDRIKRAAAKADVDRARCENCGNGVEIALLTDPNCPHCDATVTAVEEAEGFFSKPQLLVASQLESGDER